MHNNAAVSQELTSKYDVLSTLGQGGMGRVLLARHRRLKAVVAIKLLTEQAPDAAARFVREARAVAALRSRHVARVMDSVVPSEGAPFIVMEYLEGQDLAQCVASQGALAPDRAVDFMLQALEAVAEAHASGIVHRDLKPANLFAAKDPVDGICIKVLDFGLAKYTSQFDTLAGATTETGSLLGTPSYMAPEQFVNAQEADVRSDIWALGATLFELLTGTPPFRGASLPQLYTSVVHGEIPQARALQPDVPLGLEAVVATCLTRDPGGRYDSVTSLAQALSPFGGSAASHRAERIQRIAAQPRATELHGGAAEIPVAASEEPARDRGPVVVAAPAHASVGIGKRRAAIAIAIVGVIVILTVSLWPRASGTALTQQVQSARDQTAATRHTGTERASDKAREVHANETATEATLAADSARDTSDLRPLPQRPPRTRDRRSTVQTRTPELTKPANATPASTNLYEKYP